MDYDQPASNNSTNNLLDEELIGFDFEYATRWQRFVNFLIDNLVMRYAVSYVTELGIAALIRLFYPSLLDNYGTEQVNWALIVVSVIISYTNYLLYYTLCEKLLSGYTLGKLVTGTRAIREDGGELTLKNAVLRSLCRLVPFEAFSGFKIRPWHDEWTDTMVIKTR